MKLAIILLAAIPLAGQDAAALYKAKCVSCHGAAGEGKAAIAGSNLLTPEAKKRSDADAKAMIADGGKKGKVTHAFAKKGVTAAQVDALLAHVRTLQKK